MGANFLQMKGPPALSPSIRPLRSIPAEAKERLRILFIAKHALWGGGLHPEDGNHAVYHVEIRTILEELGLNLMLADRFEVLFERPEVDFVFPLLNRAGFLNSEMLGPLLCTRLGLPFVGASPILRGLSRRQAPRQARRRGAPACRPRRGRSTAAARRCSRPPARRPSAG